MSPPPQLPSKQRNKDRNERADPRPLKYQHNALAPESLAHVRVRLCEPCVGTIIGRPIFAIFLAIVADEEGPDERPDERPDEDAEHSQAALNGR